MKIILFVLLSLHAFNSYSGIHTFIGLNKSLKDVQDSNGKADDNPFSPALSLGYNFQLYDRFGFSPQLGYIHNKVTANDSYGDQKVHTLFIHYDFIWLTSFSDSLALRFGVGNFIKRISGEGGSVTIPNGSGTAQALRPDETRTSYSSTLNFGADYNFEYSYGWLVNTGLRFEFFTFRPLSKENRNYAFNFGLLFYF